MDVLKNRKKKNNFSIIIVENQYVCCIEKFAFYRLFLYVHMRNNDVFGKRLCEILDRLENCESVLRRFIICKLFNVQQMQLYPPRYYTKFNFLSMGSTISLSKWLLDQESRQSNWQIRIVSCYIPSCRIITFMFLQKCIPC